MADSIIAVVSSFLTPSANAKIAEGVAGDPTQVQKLISGALPALLSAMATSAMTPQGAKMLSDSISQQDPALMDDLAKSLGDEKQVEIAQSGLDNLNKLLGADKVHLLNNALSRFSGLDTDSTQSVVGLLQPTILGAIGRTDPSNWSDASSIATYLASQKSALSAAIPTALATTLGIAPQMAYQSAANVAPPANPIPPASATNNYNAPQMPTSNSGGLPNWIWILVALLVVGAAIWFFTHNKKEQSATPAATTSQLPETDARAVIAQTTTTLIEVTKSLAKANDGAAVNSVTADIISANSRLEQLTPSYNALDSSARSALDMTLKPSIIAAKEQVVRALAIPNVDGNCKSALEGLQAKLTALSK